MVQRPSKWLYGSLSILGGRSPYPIVALLALTLGMTLAGRLFPPLVEATFFAADWAFRGEVWRFVTWVFLEYGGGGMSLIFGCLLLAMIGRDVFYELGPKRFLGVYFGIAALSAAALGLLGLIWPDLLKMPVTGMWPVLEALIIIWAVRFPGRELRIYFVLPVGGRNLIILTIAATVIFAILGNPIAFIPHFTAELLALVYTGRISLRRLWLRLQYARLERDYRRRTSHLHEVPKDPPWLN